MEEDRENIAADCSSPSADSLPSDSQSPPLLLVPQAESQSTETQEGPLVHESSMEAASEQQQESVSANAKKEQVSSDPQQESIPANVKEEQASSEPQQISSPYETVRQNNEAILQIDSRLSEIVRVEQRVLNEVHEMHRLYHGEYAGRLRNMQEELDQYHKLESGRAFDDILSAIARIYGNYDSLPEEVQDPKAKKHLKYLFMDLEDLLTTYRVGILRSSIGDKRNVRHCQIVNRIPTSDPAKHDTIAKSHNTGFYIDNRTIIKELVDVWFYDTSIAAEDPGEEPIGSLNESTAIE